tara:strand:+ start:99720 stop:100751 length:1032 start_codon:yes stop_codon:yes gene_type:complete
MHKMYRVQVTMTSGKKKRLTFSAMTSILKRASVIDINGKYEKNKFCKSYRPSLKSLNSEYYEEAFSEIIFIPSDPKSLISMYPSVKKNILDGFKTSIDIEAYKCWLINNKGIELKPKMKKIKNIEHGGYYRIVEERTLTTARINNYLYQAAKINAHALWFSVARSGRLYSSFTNLSYTATPFFIIEGQKTAPFDLPNAQPLLLALKLEARFSEYRHAVANAQFYQLLADEMNIDKMSAKIASYRHVFFSKKTIIRSNGKIYEAMVNLFGNECITQIEDIKKNNDLSFELQKSESELFVYYLAQLDITSITKHDEIICKEEDLSLIKGRIYDYFKVRGIVISSS